MKQKGFTLIELLVVIAIIGLLASVVLVALNNARVKARDARRIADLQQVTKAMELYAADHGSQYPQTDDAYSADRSSDPKACGGPVVNGGPVLDDVPGCGWCNRWCWLSDVMKPYMSRMPKDPTNDSNHYYYYNSPAAGKGQYYGIGSDVFEDSADVAKYSNPNSALYPTGYELGPSINYCSSKYSGANASWHWSSGAPICVGGN